MAKKAEDKAPEEGKVDLGTEFAELGHALSKAINSAWNSEERNRLQNEVRSGLNQLADEIEKAAKKVRESEPAQQVESRAKAVADDVQSGKIADDMQKAIAQALRATRDAIDRMADSFTPAEKGKVEFEPLDMERGKKKDE